MLRTLLIAAAVANVVAPVSAAEPVQGCQSAPAKSSDALVCGSPLLTRLDREMQRLYGLATASAPGASTAPASADEPAWLAKRDECTKGADAGVCMRDLYMARIAAIRNESSAARNGGRGASLGPFEFQCPGATPRIVRITYANVNPSLAFVTADGKAYVLSQARSGSGARYEGQGTLFWEHQGEARWRGSADGIETTCKRVSTPQA